MASRPELISFASREAMAARVADLIEAQMRRAIAAEGAGEIAVSGGSTPEALYQELSARNLAWEKTHVTLVDERWVSTDHPRSNEAFVRSAFANAEGISITGLFNGAETPRDAVADIEACLDERAKPFDAVVIGMGDDGHTASWFPHADGLETALTGTDSVCAIAAKQSDITGTEVDRMTLTLSAIKDAQLIVLLLAGGSKRRTFENALKAGSIEDMPVRAILRARPDMWVCWAP